MSFLVDPSHLSPSKYSTFSKHFRASTTLILHFIVISHRLLHHTHCLEYPIRRPHDFGAHASSINILFDWPRPPNLYRVTSPYIIGMEESETFLRRRPHFEVNNISDLYSQLTETGLSGNMIYHRYVIRLNV